MHRLLPSHGNFIVSVRRVVAGASVVIEAQEAATEGAHVAVPEGLVPAMITGTGVAEASHNPPRQGPALSAPCPLTLSSPPYS